ncbi:hypothetical protein NX059_011527 [Plenodomus lindquistii]|nr:hypothetical protein NX059_011527 [Plenodomus lindquistii]
MGLQLNTAKYVCYQLIAGIGAGLCLQVPVIVAQATTCPEDIAMRTAILLFFQTLGGTIFISVAQNIFANRLVGYITHSDVRFDSQLVLSIGADDLRDHFSNQDLVEVLNAYLVGLRATWILGISCAGAAFIVSFGSQYRNILAANTAPSETERSSQSKANVGKDVDL